jgi:hypothetical protein
VLSFFDVMGLVLSQNHDAIPSDKLFGEFASFLLSMIINHVIIARF